MEPDWSQAGFWFAAGALENPVEVEGMTLPSLQGDWRYLEMQEQIYAGTASEIDVSQNPDLVPPLAAAAALAPGRQTRLMNAGRLRIKESDRLSSVTSVLNAMGADVEEGPDFLAIQGKERLKGGVTVDSFHDHRIAMMTAIAATRCEAPVTLTGAESVNKSYPNFWEDYVNLGGQIKRTYAMTLEPITPDNWREAVFLTTDPERKNPLDQEWLCNNAFSLLQAVYEPVCECRLIRADGKPVGFVMFEEWAVKRGEPLLCRYMIDVDCQGRGLGTQALPLVLAEMYALYGRRDVYLTVAPENLCAVRLYEGFGFRPTGEFDEREAIYRLSAPEGA